MNRFYTFLLLWLALFCQKINGQSVALEGVIKDSLQNPLELANVIAINKNSKAVVSFGVSDYLGRFRLKLRKDSVYIVKVSYIGFKAWEAEVQPKSSIKIIKNIVLKSAANELNGVEVVYELPISMDGDTITYKADAFVNGKERKLKDVLEKLPGFEIDENGDVKVQGKKISEILVEGEKFFDGNSKMAIKNIPANAIDKVQLLRNYNDVGPMKGLGDQDNIALNIKLKDGKKNLWFGDIKIGSGPKGRYVAHPNLFYYSKKASINFIGDANNIGDQAFTMSDYFRFSGGFKNLAKKAGSSLNISSDDIGLSMLQNNRAESITTKMGALNFNLKPSKKWNFSGFAIVTGLDTDMRSHSFKRYLREDGAIEETLLSTNKQKNTSGLFKVSATHKPNSKVHISYDGFIKTAKIKDLGNSLSTYTTIEDNIVSVTDKSPFAIEQSFEAFYAKDAKNVFSFEANYLYKKQNPLYDLMKTEIPFNGNLTLSGDSPYRLLQHKEIYTNKLDASFNYYYVLNKTNHINVTLGTSITHQSLNTSIEEKLNSTTTEKFVEPYLNNDVAYSFSDVFIGLMYKTKLGRLTLVPGANLHFYNTEDVQLGTANKQKKTLLLPKFRAKYKFTNSARLNLNYEVQAQFTDIQNVALGTVIRGYNSLFSGNRNLKNAWYHTVNVSFYDFNMFNFTNISVNLNYQKKYDDIQNQLTDSGGVLNRILSPINIDAANENLTVRGSYEKRLGLVKLKGSVSMSYANYENKINNIAVENESFTQSYKASIDTNFNEWPNFEIGYELVSNNYKSIATKSTFITNKPFVNLEAYFLKNFTVTADYKYNNYKNKIGTTNSVYDFLDVALYYKKPNSGWEFKLSGQNLMNTTSIRQDGFSNSLISTYSYYVQPRYFLLSTTYNL